MHNHVSHSRPDISVSASTAQPLLQRCGDVRCPPGACDHDGQETQLQRHATGAGPAVAPPIVGDVLRSAGRPLDETTQASMGRAFGHDFSQVRVHTDGQAATSAHAVRAHAYTVGQQVVFGAGQFQPGSETGRRLLAHELSHTIQQRGSFGHAEQLRVSAPGETGEVEADRASAAVAGGRPSSVPARAEGVLARQPAGPSPSPEEQERELQQQREQERLKQEFERTRSVESQPGSVPNLWGWGGAETKNIYQECRIAPMDRPTFVAFQRAIKDPTLQGKPGEQSTTLGITVRSGPAEPPRIETVAVTEDGRTVHKLKPTRAKMPPIMSAYTRVTNQSKEFVEGRISVPGAPADCKRQRGPDGKFDVVWRLPEAGENLVRQGEQEHCDDIRYAFNGTLGWYASLLNNLAATERTYSSPKQVAAAATDVLRGAGVTPETMLSPFENAVKGTAKRDQSGGWHDPKCVQGTHCLLPDVTNGCRYVHVIDARSLPEIGKGHPSSEVITFDTPATQPGRARPTKK
jgi:hypothetical protein